MKFFRINGEALPVEFQCEAESCSYTPSLNERCRNCLYLKTKLDAVDFYKIINEISFKGEKT